MSDDSFTELIRAQRQSRDKFDAYANHFLLPQDFNLAEQTPVEQPTPSDIDAMQNDALFEGDIIGISPLLSNSEDSVKLAYNFDVSRDHSNIDEAFIFNRPYHSSLNTATYPDKLWTGGRVPYMLEDGMTDSQRAAIAQAFDEYKQKTCIRFVPKEAHDNDYIYVKRNVAYGCSSYVGRAGGNQTVSLEIGKCFSKGIIAHELMHSIGFFHEHSRTDRDQFVLIDENNVRNGMLRNFEKYPRKIIDPLEMSYDYDSVMHYHKLAFSKNGKPTIQPRNPAAEIGQRYKLSKIDAMKVNKLYHCDEILLTITTTESTTSTKSSTKIVENITIDKSGFVTDKTNNVRRIEERTTTTPSIISTSSTTFSIANILLPAISLPREIYHIIKGKDMNELSTKRYEKTLTTTLMSVSSSEEEESEERTEVLTQPKTIENKHQLVTILISNSAKTSKELTTSTIDSHTEYENREKKCIDMNAHCEMWERLGHCEHSTKYMRHYCRKSCGFCGNNEDNEENSETSYKSSKPPAARAVRSCADKNLFCSYWARIGECRSESKFMRIFCRRSCGNCDD